MFVNQNIVQHTTVAQRYNTQNTSRSRRTQIQIHIHKTQIEIHEHKQKYTNTSRSTQTQVEIHEHNKLIMISLKNLPSNIISVVRKNMEEAVIRYYFGKNYQYKIILEPPEKFHGITISKGTLLNRLNEYGLRPRGNVVDRNRVREAIQQELDGSGQTLGYRAMWRRLCSLNMTYKCLL